MPSTQTRLRHTEQCAHCMALTLKLALVMGILRRQLQGWSIGCVSRLPREPAAGEGAPRALGLDQSLPCLVSMRDCNLPPREGGPFRLSCCTVPPKRVAPD